MAKFNVYSPDGQTIKYSGAPTYHGTYLKPSYLEFTTISSPTAISWSIGDYIVYSRTGLTYRLYDIPQPTKKATSGASGESFVYSNVQFYADTKKLEVVPFRDLVIDQGQTTAYHFSTLNSVDTFENVAGICARIQKNMENFYGNGTWSFVVASGLVGFNETEAREFSVSGGTCLSALEKIYEVWPELGWAYSLVNGVHTITVGAPNVRTSDNTTNLYQYGKDNGLTMIKKTQQNKDEFCTRLFAYGSSRNMINRYYNGKDIYEAASVYIPNLMIPSSFWGTSGLPPKPDASKAYIDNLIAQASYGVIPKIVYFDGNEQKEVYPSITETTIAMLKAAKTALGKTDPGKPDYFPQDADGTHRLDEIIGVPSPITDNGDTSNSGQKYIVDETSAISSGMHSGSATPEGPLAIIEFDLDAYNFATGGEVIIKPTTTLTIDANSPDQLSVSASIVVGSTPRIAENIAVTEVSTGTYTCTLPELKTGDVNNPASGNVKYHISVRARWEEISTSQLVTVNNDASSISWRAKKILIKTFKLKLRQIGFDVMERAALSGNGNPTIAFKDGKCIAKSFSIKSATYNSSDDTWTLTVYRGIDTSISMMYPNSTYPVAVGDHFVLLDLAMPDEYIEMASVKLKNEADALLAKLSKIEPFYEPSVDAKVVANNIASHPSTESYILREGKYMHITDADVVGVNEYVIIDTLTINENESNIPTYRVTLREKKKESFTQSIENAIQSLQSAGSTSLSSTTDSDGNYVSKEDFQSHTGDTNNPHATTFATLGGNLDASQVPYLDASKINAGVFGVARIPDLSGSYVSIASKGIANGVASLGSDGKVPTAQLPSYVDDVLEYASKSAFPATGESGKIYVALDTNLTYRWSGSAYVEISPSLALGETSSTAYRGDRGKEAYDHISRSDNPHNVTLAQAAGQSLADKLTALASWFEYDENNHAIRVKEYIGESQVKTSFYAYGEVTAGGIGSGGGGGGSVVTWNQITGASGNTHIADITINGSIIPVYAPSGGSGVTAFNDLTGRPQYNGTAMTSSTDIPEVKTAIWDGKQDAATAITTSNIGSQSVAYATSAGNADTLDSLHEGSFMRVYGSDNYDCNESVRTGVYRFSGSPTHASPNAAWSQMLVIRGSDDTAGQIIAEYGTQDWYVRAGTWYSSSGTLRTNSWHKLYHSGNCNNTSTPWSASTLTLNGAISGATTISASSLAIYNTTDYAIPLNIVNTKGGLSADVQIINKTITSVGIGFGYDDATYKKGFIKFKADTANTASATNRISFDIYGSDNILNILGNGNVGIGTTSPSYKLHVNGSAYASYFKAGGDIGVVRGSDDRALISYYPAGCFLGHGMPEIGKDTYIDGINIYARIAATNTIAFSILSSGYVGIGTTSPSAKLDVKGTARFVCGHFYGSNPSLGNLEQGTIRINAANAWGGCSVYGLYIWVDYQSGRVSMQSGYEQGVSSEPLPFAIQPLGGDCTFGGNIVANGEITAGSDRRWKHNIESVNNGLSVLMALKPSTWNWNDDNRKGYGLIAQDVQEVIPSLVKTDNEGYLHLTYDGLHAFEISAIQSHETEIDRLKKRVKELENRIAQLS